MLELKVKILKTELKLVSQPEVFTEGLKNYAKVVFEFGPDWDGLGKTATFKRVLDQHAVTVNIANNECIIPYEVFAYPQVELSVRGADSSTAITSSILRFDVRRNLDDGAEPQPSTPNIYDQILEASQAAEDKANKVYEDSQAGKFDSTIEIGSVLTGTPGSKASVKNSGTKKNAILDFVIPRGVPGSGSGVSGDYLPTSGGTLTGNIAIDTGTTEPNVILKRTVDGSACELATRIDSEAKAGLRYKVSGSTVNELILEQTKTRLRKPLDMASGGVPTSGTTGQVLTKTASGHEWKDIVQAQSGKAVILDPETETPAVLDIAGGGTGADTAKEAQFNLLADMNTAKDEVTDANSLVMAYNGSTANNGAVYKASMGDVRAWIDKNEEPNNLRTTKSGSIVQFNAAKNAFIERGIVEGKTRQNLWVNQSGTNSGVTVVSNKDGSIAIEGTNVSSSSTYFNKRVYSLKPNTTYTLSSDKSPEGFNFSVREDNSSGEPIIGHSINSSSELSVSFTTKSNMASALLYIGVEAGASVSGTYRIMLNEGDTAEPWCPPGLNSVSKLELNVSAKNILKPLSTLKQTTTNGITFTPQDDGGIKVKGTSSGTAYYNLDFSSSSTSATLDAMPFVGKTIAINKGANSDVNFVVGVYVDSTKSSTIANTAENKLTGIVPDNAIKFRSYLSVPSGKTVNTILYPQIELGSVATEYEKPQLTTKTIDLNANELCSLPDGTRDELNFVSCKLNKNCKVIVLDGSDDEQFSITGNSGLERFNYTNERIYSNASSTTEIPTNIRCDKLPVDTPSNTWFGRNDMRVSYTGASGVHILCFVVKSCSTVEEFRQWLSDNPLTIVAQLAEPETIQLDPVDIPMLPSDVSNVWLTSNIDAEGEFTANRSTANPEIVIDALWPYISAKIESVYGLNNTQ